MPPWVVACEPNLDWFGFGGKVRRVRLHRSTQLGRGTMPGEGGEAEGGGEAEAEG